MALQLHSRVSTKSQFHLVKQIKPPLVGTKLTLYISSTDAEWSNKEKFQRNARKQTQLQRSNNLGWKKTFARPDWKLEEENLIVYSSR